MGFIQRAQAAVDAIQSSPTPVSLTVMLGSLVLSILQPIAVCVTIMWGTLQIHGWIEKKWGRDFLYLNRLLRKDK